VFKHPRLSWLPFYMLVPLAAVLLFLDDQGQMSDTWRTVILGPPRSHLRPGADLGRETPQARRRRATGYSHVPCDLLPLSVFSVHRSHRGTLALRR